MYRRKNTPRSNAWYSRLFLESSPHHVCFIVCMKLRTERFLPVPLSMTTECCARNLRANKLCSLINICVSNLPCSKTCITKINNEQVRRISHTKSLPTYSSSWKRGKSSFQKQFDLCLLKSVMIGRVHLFSSCFFLDVTRFVTLSH